MADLAAMRQARGQLKSRVTRFTTWLSSFDSRTGDFGNLQSRLDDALPIMAEFNDLQNRIEEADQASDHEADRLSFEDSYYATIGQAKTLLARQNNATPNSIITTDTVNQSHTVISSGIKLPIMSLPEFDGNYDQWLNFRDTFKALIHDNTAVTDIQKFYYLRSSLKETAAEVIGSLTASAENYTIAWELLTKRFNNNKLMISRHLQALVDTPVMQKESGLALRQMLDHAQRLTRSLKTLKANTWDALLTHHIASKMDNMTKREWKDYTKDIEMPTEENLISFLEERCSIVDTDVVTKNGNKLNPSAGDVRNSKPKRGYYSFTGVSTNSPICKVCENSHEVFKCAVFRNLSVVARTIEAKKHKLCLNCLRVHSGKCTFGRCRKCQKFHNSLLHVDSNQTTTVTRDSGAPTSDPEQPQTLTNQGLNTGPFEGATISKATVPFTGAIGTTRSQVLLSTALVLVEDRHGKTHECRALLDSGSQSNLMTRELSERLLLLKESYDMPIGGINNTSTNVSERLKLTIRSRQHAYKSTLPVFVVDEIVTQHPTTWIDAKQLRILENLTLADPTLIVQAGLTFL